MVDDGLQRDGHVADVVGLHSGGQVTESARALRRTRGRLRELCRVAELQLQLLDSSGEATAASDLRPLPHSRRGWRRDGAPRGATELETSVVPELRRTADSITRSYK